ncbi:MAG: peptide-methionine (S)-S-oxide reductase MsrA [Acidobacteriaceae bacterium]
MFRFALPVIVLLAVAAVSNSSPRKDAVILPAPVVDVSPQTKGEQTAVFAGGCFWGIQSVFQHVKGVVSATSGYVGGDEKSAEYEIVSTGNTGHAESVKIVYNPSQITYGQLLRVFFSVAHDPTQLNRQGPDEGSQYRSAIFYSSDEQKRVAEAYIVQLQKANVFARPIVTSVKSLGKFYPAEAYHQNYAERHPKDLYIVYNDAPKVSRLSEEFPDLYVARP